jgi:hypothetical protein
MRLIKKTRLTMMACLLSFIAIADASQTHRVDSNTQAETWETSGNGVTFSLTQILPDQARAFYVNRGFTLEQIEPYANSCVYMTVLRNDSAPDAIHYELKNWSIMSDTKSRPPIMFSDWLKKLEAENAPKPALIAFRWAQFPPDQTYEPGGDWNQGMLTTGLLPGSRFDAVARWNMNGKQYEGVLRDVLCAK